MPSPRRHRPQLTTKTQPAQQRATETFERLLEAAAQTLAEVGIERWSTNLVCEHAGVSPPALYRYFPNKYALLTELTRRLMERQNECIAHHIHEGVFAGGIPALEKALRFTPRNPANGLVRITDPALFRPYSFFDTIPLTGDQQFDSVLFWDACRKLAEMFVATGQPDRAAPWRHEAECVQSALNTLWDERTGFGATRSARVGLPCRAFSASSRVRS